MSMKITDKILCIPPYISTSWAQIAAIHMKGDLLILTLADGESLEIPHLASETIQFIFLYHTNHLEKEASFNELKLTQLSEMIKEDEPSVRLAFSSSLDGMGNMMQHDPNQANAPDLPPEVIQKIGAISQIIAPSDEMQLPCAESGCNCFHCQIARALNPHSAVVHSIAPAIALDESEVSEIELSFQQWSITQTGDKLYTVVSRLDEHENYHVFLGEPVGCTCGQQGCEHVLAVLRS